MSFKYGMVFALLAVAVFTIQAASAQSGSIGLDIRVDGANYTPNQQITGDIVVNYDYVIPARTKLKAYVDDDFKSAVILNNFLRDADEYSNYKDMQFIYKLQTSGTAEWFEYPDQTFSFTITASGTCGNNQHRGQCAQTGTCICNDLCTPPTVAPYYCSWSAASTSFGPFSVNGYPSQAEALKYMLNRQDAINVPPDHRNDTLWTVTNTNPAFVKTDMIAACGNDNYVITPESLLPTASNGWVTRELDVSLWDSTGGSGRESYIEQFDGASIGTDMDRYNYGTDTGGIYADGVYLQDGVDASWDGDIGYIKIFNFNPLATYTITYLPPVGDKICAFTDYSKTSTSAWTSEGPAISGTTDYKTDYVSSFPKSGMPQPSQSDCPDNPPETECKTTGISGYSAAKISGQDVIVSSSYDVTTQILTVTATTDVTEFSTNESDKVSLENFTGLVVGSAGMHTLKIDVVDSGNQVLFSEEAEFGICHDLDADGYCGATDCDDDITDDSGFCPTNKTTYDPSDVDCTNTSYSSCAKCVNPGATELCDSFDNNCDDQIDEAFWQEDSKLGDVCGDAGVCTGVWTCRDDGSGVVCNNSLHAGDQDEVCGNNIDDDCDGETDELFECADENCTEYIPSCIACEDGDARSCGSSIGACNIGVQTCEFGEWGDCVQDRSPSNEICNQLDDDCDGVRDNVNEGTSEQATKCGCYNGASKSAEVCNDIDDDCDGDVDEGLSCCTHGDSRSCGTDAGACNEGIEVCSHGSWGLCVGSKGPVTEICYNNIDDDCNEQTDEGCIDIGETCTNGEQDEEEEGIDCGGVCPDECGTDISFILIIAGVLVFVVLIILVGYFKSQGKELTWEELRKKWTPATQ